MLPLIDVVGNNIEINTSMVANIPIYSIHINKCNTSIKNGADDGI